MEFAADELTQNRFLDGKLNIYQPRNGYRAGADPVLLASAIPASAGQDVLELGCGAGVAILSLGRRVPGLNLVGVELQEKYAILARRNAVDNKIDLDVLTSDLRHLPPVLLEQSFDHVLMNPPYFERTGGTKASDDGRERALGGDTPLANWVDVAARRLKPKGVLTMIQRTNRLPEVLVEIKHGFGDVEVKPLAPRSGRAADIFLLRAKKGGRGPFRLLAPLVLHDGAQHLADGDTYSRTVRSILRDGQALEF